MDFLDKLYESNYFGIGLFAVISFLVVTFLIVLFFGKKDEKKRSLEATRELEKATNENAFKETSVETPVEVPASPVGASPVVEPTIVEPTVIEPAMPIMEEPVREEVKEEPVIPVAPINFVEEPITPVAPISYEGPTNFVENKQVEEVTPINIPIAPVINEEPTPIITEPIQSVEPIRLEPTAINTTVEPRVIEPIRINIPEEPVKVEPVIGEERPVVTPVMSDTPRVVEPVVNETYYKPIEKAESEEIEVPNIDFDALAKSISEELDELEKSSNKEYEPVKVTPINEVVAPKPVTQFSSVYVNEPQKPVTSEVELPKKIDLPTIKSDEIEPENYNI